MLSVGVLMFMLPFFIFITLGGSIAAAQGDPRLLVALFLIGAVLMYLVSAGAFTLIQNHSCNKVQSAGKIASNAGTATAIYAGFVALAAFIPKLRSIVTNIISPEGDRILVSASTVEAEVRQQLAGQTGGGGNAAAATLVGKRVAEKAKAAGIELVAFDRSGFRYHGRIKALADAAREAGLKF